MSDRKRNILIMLGILQIIEIVSALYCSAYFLAKIGENLLVSRIALYIFLALLTTVVIGLFSYDNHSRLLFLKVVLFVLVLAISIKKPWIAVAILTSVFTYQLLTSEGKSATPALPILALILLYLKAQIKPLFLVSGFCFIYFLLCIYTGLRSGILFGVISLLMIIFPIGVRGILIRSLPYFIFVYIGVMVTFFALFVGGLLSESFATASNVERSSMISNSIFMMSDYILTGPRLSYDNMVAVEIRETGVTELYDSDYGVDPHNFVLSLWKDEGIIVALIWLAFYFNVIQSMINRHLNSQTSYSLAVLVLLAYPVVHFTLSPPSTDNRLMVAAFLGLCSALLSEGNRSLGNRPQEPKA
jgi:hypothetical protein